jgi:hypothetical protein
MPCYAPMTGVQSGTGRNKALEAKRMADRDESTTAQLKVRMKEPLRALLEDSARERGISMNAEIVRRLERSFERRDRVINGVALGAELYRVLTELGSFQRRINDAFSSDELGITPKRIRDEVVSAALDLASSKDRVIQVLEALLPSDQGLEITKIGDDIRIVTRTIQDEAQ